MRRLGLALAATLLATAAGCSGDQGPVAGELSVRLATPRSSDRAILFTVLGRASEVTAAAGRGYAVFTATSAGGDSTSVVVAAPAGGGLAAGELARVAVPDVRKVAAYAVRLVDVAAGTYADGDTAGVSLSIVRP